MQRNLSSIDFLLLFLFLVIVTFGILNIHSVSPESANKQLLYFGIAAFIGLCFFLVQSLLFESIAFISYIFGIALLGGVLIFGKEISGAKAWYVFGPISFQPVELVKISTSLTIAAIVSSSHFDINKYKSILQIIGVLVLPILLILMQPDVGSILVFMAFAIALYREGINGIFFVIGFYLIWHALHSIILTEINEAPFIILALDITIRLCIIFLIFLLLTFLFKWFKIKLKIFLIFGFILISTIGFSYTVSKVFPHMPKHQKERIMVLFEGEKKYRDTSGYNLLYSKSAIAVGQVTGSGYNQGTVTKGKFVPEQRTDYIFCTVGEEWGFIGSALLVLTYMFFIIRIYVLSEQSKNTFLRVFGYCFGSIVLMHFIINIGMVLGLFPTVGIPLPYFSYGGSSMLGFTLSFFIFLRLVYADKSSLV